MLKLLRLILSALGRRITAQREDLVLFTLVQAFLLAVAFAFCKVQAVRFTFPFDTFSEQVMAWLVGFSQDLLAAGVVALLGLAASFLPKPGHTARWILFAALQSISLAWICVTIFNLAFYMQLGSPLKYQALQLIQGTTGLFVKNIVQDHPSELISIVLISLAFVCVSPLIQTWLTNKIELRKPRLLLPACASAALLAGGVGLCLLPAPGFREEMLREMNVTGILFQKSETVQTGIAPPTPAELKILTELCKDKNEAGTQAFKNFPRKKYNVILWVWESIGSRYIKSLHPLGESPTPNLDRIMASGSVSFSECRSECPFSAQSAWSLISGMSPPARPIWFALEDPMPPHKELLPPALKANGYATALFNASEMKVARMDRIMQFAGFDVCEDSTNMKGREKYRSNAFGLEDASAVERCLNWVDERDKDKPFFCMLWNNETHNPCKWIGMPEDLQNADDYTRYTASITQSDKHLGEVYQGLLERKLDRETILIVLGDHGQALGRLPYPYHFGHAYHVEDDANLVPFVIAHPDLKNSTKEAVRTICSMRDLYPTIFELTGQKIPDGLQGHALSQPFQAEPLFVRSIGWWPISVLAGKYKLSLYHPSQLPQLFDMEKDWFEKENVSQKHMDTTRALLNTILRETERRFKDDPTFSWGWSFNSKAKPKAAPNVSEIVDELAK